MALLNFLQFIVNVIRRHEGPLPITFDRIHNRCPNCLWFHGRMECNALQKFSIFRSGEICDDAIRQSQVLISVFFCWRKCSANVIRWSKSKYFLDPPRRWRYKVLVTFQLLTALHQINRHYVAPRGGLVKFVNVAELKPGVDLWNAFSWLVLMVIIHHRSREGSPSLDGNDFFFNIS